MEYGVALGMGRKRKFGKNYVRLCEMDRILHSEIMRKLATDILRVGWRIRAIKYERLKKRREDSLFRCC